MKLSKTQYILLNSCEDSFSLYMPLIIFLQITLLRVIKQDDETFILG